MVQFIDTRSGKITGMTFSDVIIKGLAPSGGLFVPNELPRMTADAIKQLRTMPYHERAAAVYKLFNLDIADDELDALCRASYAKQFDDERIAVIETPAPHTHVLELWHGPTSAFKDMALQCMPRLFSAALGIKRAQDPHYPNMMILVATSGDTGKAALEGFAEREGCSITVLYPESGVSQIQRKQMVTQQGNNVQVYGVRGNFDDCQNTVKAVFNDASFNEKLKADRNVLLSSANSINFGRLMPQIVYYLSACADLWDEENLGDGAVLDVCVPTGNFGNILGAYYAKCMGAPLGRLICASNENKILTDFLSTGTYDISERPFIKTPSPSMDILISSNMERMLYHLADAQRVARWMQELKENRCFTVDKETFEKMRELFSADFATNEESLATIKEVYDEHHYVCDPHTAVAWEVGQRTRDAQNPLLIVSTAHWAKFAPDVLRAFTQTPAGSAFEAPYAAQSEFEQLESIRELAPEGSPIPRNLATLKDAEERFNEVIDAGAPSCEERLISQGRA